MPKNRWKRWRVVKEVTFRRKNVLTISKYDVCLQITGILIIGVGTTIEAVYNNFDTFLEDRFYSPATMLIAIGCIVFVVAFFGCCGAVRESTCMIMFVSSPHHKSIFNFSMLVLCIYRNLTLLVYFHAIVQSLPLKSVSRDQLNTLILHIFSDTK